MVREKAEVEAAKGAAEGQAGRLSQEVERLRRRAQELENEVAKLNRIIDDAKLQESRLGDKVGRLEVRGGTAELQIMLVFLLHSHLLHYYTYILNDILIFTYVHLTEREKATGRVFV